MKEPVETRFNYIHDVHKEGGRGGGRGGVTVRNGKCCRSQVDRGIVAARSVARTFEACIMLIFTSMPPHAYCWSSAQRTQVLSPPRPAPPRVPPSLLVVSFANETQSLARKFHRSIAEISPLRLKTDGTFGRERSTGTIYLAHDTESLFFLSELPLNDPVPLPAYALQSFPEVLLQLFQLLQRSSLGIVVVCAHTKHHVYRYLLTRKQRTGR